MEISEILKIKDAVEYNKKLDQYLKTTDTIDESVTNRFWDAYQYGATTTVQWLEKKLNIIEMELKNGKEYYIVNENINNVTDFKKWISDTYPDLIN